MKLYAGLQGFSGFYHTEEDLHLIKKVTTFEEFITAVNNCTKILTAVRHSLHLLFLISFRIAYFLL